MAYNKSKGSEPASATETVNIPASGGRGKNVDFGNKRQSYGGDKGGGMGAPEDLQRVPSSGRASSKINFPSNPFAGAKPAGPKSVKYKSASLD